MRLSIDDQVQQDYEDRLQQGADIKERLAAYTCALAELAVLFADEGNAGALASQVRCSTHEINVWANAYAMFGPDFINAESDPLDAKWWGALLKTDDPVAWLEKARNGQWNAAQIREAAGVKQERRQPLYTGGGTLDGDTIYLDSVADGKRQRVAVRATEKGD